MKDAAHLKLSNIQCASRHAIGDNKPIMLWSQETIFLNSLLRLNPERRGEVLAFFPPTDKLVTKLNWKVLPNNLLPEEGGEFALLNGNTLVEMLAPVSESKVKLGDPHP